MTLAKVREAMKAADVDWLLVAETVTGIKGWNAVGCVAWRSNRKLAGRDVSHCPAKEWFEMKGERVKVIGSDCEFGNPTTLFEFPDGAVFGVNTELVRLLDGMELRGIRTAHTTIMLAGVKNGRNEIVIAERRVQ